MSTELRPEWMINEDRVKEIREALHGVLAERDYINIDWIVEYNRRIEDSRRNKAKLEEEKICGECLCRTCGKNGPGCQGCDSCIHGYETYETTAVKSCDKYEGSTI